MRTSFLFVSLAAAVALAACSDHDQLTSPTAKVRPEASNVSTEASQASPSPQAKPVDQVGFTKVVFYVGDWITFDAGSGGFVMVACPPGTVVTGGGYDAIINGTPPLVYKSRPIGAGEPSGGGWKVWLSNAQVGAAPVKVSAWAGCAS